MLPSAPEIASCTPESLWAAADITKTKGTINKTRTFRILKPLQRQFTLHYKRIIAHLTKTGEFNGRKSFQRG
jgi:hypothetical protein